MESLLVEKAYAKINLGIKIVGRRPDGYHEILSVAQCVDLADVLDFELASSDQLTCSLDSLSTGPDNLVCRAVDAFHAQLDRPAQSFRIHLEKNIPIGAGLGGGSADAAAALRALNRFYDQPFSNADLRQIAATLGSDIPFLVEGGTALMRGRGEILESLSWEGAVFYVLAYPDVEISTAWAYGQLGPSLTGNSPYFNFIVSLSGGCVDHDRLFEVLENDFTPAVERTYPIVAELRSQLDRVGARATLMSGSGSTVYGIFDDRKTASQAQSALQRQGCRSFLCQPV
ncbi:MAG: 4-(cytidine 5'-diphospho)-2-C-methyl-D-erythritol kinase [Gemmatimonadetes bacterium]|nr:4-(cytidine 5'-diphospho)-2-C-methyl-D-erythritol kinase [Gemmatimonadota bacterium]